MGNVDAIRVLLVMTARTVGGAEIYVERLVALLSDTCQFTIALPDHPDMMSFAQRLRGRAQVLTVAFPFDRMSQLPAIARHLRQLATEYDVIHLNSNHPGSRLGILMGCVLSSSGRPVVCVEHGATAISNIKVPHSIAWSLPTIFRWSRRSIAVVVTGSDQSKRTLVGLYRLPSDKVIVVHNGVDLAPFANPNPPTLRAELDLAADQPVIIVLGRLTPQKGQRYLIDAAPTILAEHPSAHFVFAGNPEGRADLEQHIHNADLESHVSLIGFRSDVVNLLRSSDLFVLPSLAEGFSLSIPEAMAAGLPVVATRVGGAAEIIEEGRNGFLVPPADASALAAAVNHVLGLDPVAKARLRQAALQTAERFSFSITARKMLDIYQRVRLARP